MKRRTFLTVAAAAALARISPPASAAEASAPPQLGINLSGPSDWMTELPLTTVATFRPIR